MVALVRVARSSGGVGEARRMTSTLGHDATTAAIACSVTCVQPLMSSRRTVPIKGMIRSNIGSVTGDPAKVSVPSTERRETFIGLQVLYSEK